MTPGIRHPIFCHFLVVVVTSRRPMKSWEFSHQKTRVVDVQGPGWTGMLEKKLQDEACDLVIQAKPPSTAQEGAPPRQSAVLRHGLTLAST